MPPGHAGWQFDCAANHECGVILMPERLEAMAKKLLALPARSVHVAFTGFQPAWHPHLGALMKLFNGSEKDISAAIECGAGQNHSFYRELYKLGRPETTSLNLYIDSATPKFRESFETIAFLSSTGIPFRVYMAGKDPGQRKFVYDALLRLQKIIPFELGESPASAGSPNLAGRQAGAEFAPAGEGFFCIQGASFIRIDASGAVHGAPCICDPLPQPLWTSPGDLLPHFRLCGRNDCPAQEVWGLPRFDAPEAAREFIRGLRQRFFASATVAADQPSPVPDGALSFSGAAGVAPPRASVTGSLSDFAAAFKNRGNDADAKKMIEALYQEKRDKILAELALAHEHGAWHLAAPAEILTAIAASAPALAAILADYARLYCASRKIALPLETDIPDPGERAGVEAFGDAENPTRSRPLLSVVMPNFDKATKLRTCLESALSQSWPDFELLIVDDASTDESMEILAHYAANDARIRLWRSRRRMLAGICRNFALDRARGGYVIFVDSDDICLPGFFEDAVREIRASGADAVLFSSAMVRENGELIWKNVLADSSFGRVRAMRAFFEGHFQPAPWAKIFDLNFLKVMNCRFARHVYHQDAPFFFDCLQNARALATRAKVVYENVTTANSAMRPQRASYRRLHSAYVFQNFFQRAASLTYGTRFRADMPLGLALHNIENCLLPNATAFAANGKEILVAADHNLIADSPVFARAVLGGFGKLLAGLKEENNEAV